MSKKWTYEDIMGVMREIQNSPQPERQSADFYCARLLLDARAEVAALKAEIKDAYEEIDVACEQRNFMASQLAAARIDAQIEALEWARGFVDNGLDAICDIYDDRIAELCAEKEKLK